MLWRTIATVTVAVVIAAADLVHKAIAATPEWAYHVRSSGWLALTVGVTIGCLALVRVPSWAVAIAAGMLAGGAAGNALSAVGSTEGVPNPIVVNGPHAIVAFNLADVFTLTGILLLTALLVVVTIDRREQVEAMRRRVTQRRSRR